MKDDRRVFAASWIALVALVLALIYQLALEPAFLDYGQILALCLIALAIPLGAIRITRTPLREGLLLGRASGRAFLSAAVLALGCLPWAFLLGMPFERAFIAQGFPALPKFFDHPWVDPWRAGFAVVVLAPVALELFWRGFVLGAFLGSGGKRAGRAAFLVAAFGPLLFGMDPLDIVSMLPLSVGLAAIAYASRSVLPAILGHFIWNAAGFCYNYWNLRDAVGASVKGAAVLGLVALALGALAAAFLLMRRSLADAFRRRVPEESRAAEGASRQVASSASPLARAGRIAPVVLFVAISLCAAIPRAADLWFRAPPPALSFGEAPWMRDYDLKYQVLDTNGVKAGELGVTLRRDDGKETLVVAGSWAGSAYTGEFVWERASMDLLSAKVSIRGASVASIEKVGSGGKALLPIEWAFRVSSLRMPEPSTPIDRPFVDLSGAEGVGPLMHIIRLNIEVPAGKFHCDRVDQYRAGEFFRSAYLDLDVPSFPVRFFDQGFEFLLESAAEAR